MLPYLTTHFGNPSSVYSYGRETRLAIENARKTVAGLLGALPKEIFFTSCGTEATNMAIHGSMADLGCRRIITSPTEHHATLHTIDHHSKQYKLPVDQVRILANGQVDLAHLDELLQKDDRKCFVSLMHANNEIGNMMDIMTVGQKCFDHNAIFHCDTVQTIGHYVFDLKKMPVHFITGSAHKFHGPKGIGFLYMESSVKIGPYLLGGSQERNMRAGTENVYGIVGLAKALQLATETYEHDKAYIEGLKTLMKTLLCDAFGDSVIFHGDPSNSLYTVLSVGFLKSDRSDMLLFNLDIRNICASGGSACSSGANQGSHVLAEIDKDNRTDTIRFSFSKYNTEEEIRTTVSVLKEVLG